MEFNPLSLRRYQHLQAELKKTLGKESARAKILLGDFLAGLADQLEPGTSKRFLNFALDLGRPYLQSLGLRITRLSFQEIEVILPGKLLYQNRHQESDAGAVISAALFAYRRLWKKNLPRGSLTVQLSQLELEVLQPLNGSLYIRAQLPILQRETIYAMLANDNRAEHEGQVQVFNAQSQLLARLTLKVHLHLLKSLSWK